MSAANRSFLHRFSVSYTQPPEFPLETADNPARGDEMEGDWAAHMGQMVRGNEEMEGENRRRPREVDLKFDTPCIKHAREIPRDADAEAGDERHLQDDDSWDD
jgi:hypothetical protein